MIWLYMGIAVIFEVIVGIAGEACAVR